MLLDPLAEGQALWRPPFVFAVSPQGALTAPHAHAYSLMCLSIHSTRFFSQSFSHDTSPL